MRFYSIVRKSDRVVFSESKMRFYDLDTIYIPSAFPKIFDPYICWRGLPNKDGIRQMIMKDLDNETWLIMKCKHPLNKVLTAGTDVEKEMR
jgi:hypothetical protein